MPNEILNIQHTITQLQNVEKVQAVGQQREQYQQKAEAVRQREEKELEQTIVQISEEAEKILLQDERNEKQDGDKREKREKSEKQDAGEVDGDEENGSILDIVA